MAVVVKASVPSSAFKLGQVFDAHPGLTVEFERTVPFDDNLPSLVWTHDVDPNAVESTLRGWDWVECVSSLTDSNGGGLFELRWLTERDHLSRTIAETDLRVLDITGSPDTWEFQLWFSEHSDLIGFNEALTGAGIPVTLEKVSNSLYEDTQTLSDEQLEALSLAYQRGYFEVPRQCTKQDLADAIGISDSAYSQRLRRAIAVCVEKSLDSSTLLRRQ